MIDVDRPGGQFLQQDRTAVNSS